jgi:hypothetical protein
MKDRLLRLALAGALVFGAGAGIACDKEDKQDVKEFGNDVEKGAKKVGNGVEHVVDDNIDTDGQDD